jgi:hypothetical protein
MAAYVALALQIGGDRTSAEQSEGCAVIDASRHATEAAAILRAQSHITAAPEVLVEPYTPFRAWSATSAYVPIGALVRSVGCDVRCARYGASLPGTFGQQGQACRPPSFLNRATSVHSGSALLFGMSMVDSARVVR